MGTNYKLIYTYTYIPTYIHTHIHTHMYVTTLGINTNLELT